MAKACDFCKRINEYICDPESHCGLCPKGQPDPKPKKKEATK